MKLFKVQVFQDSGETHLGGFAGVQESIGFGYWRGESRKDVFKQCHEDFPGRQYSFQIL